MFNFILALLILVPSIVFACDLSKLVTTCSTNHQENEQMNPVMFDEMKDSHCFDGLNINAQVVNDACAQQNQVNVEVNESK